MQDRVLLSLALVLTVTCSNTSFSQPKGEKPRLETVDNGHSGPITKILFDKEGRRLISVSHDKTMRVWDVASGEPLSVLHMPWSRQWGNLDAAALAPDQDTLAVAGWGAEPNSKLQAPRIFLISLKNEEIIKTLMGHAGSIQSLSFSADGKQLASGGDGSIVRVWNISTGQALELSMPGDDTKENVQDVRFHPLEANVLMSATHKQVRIWNVAKKFASAIEAPIRFKKVAWSQDGKRFAACGPGRKKENGGIFVWDSPGVYFGRSNPSRNYTSFGGFAFAGTGDGALIVSAREKERNLVIRLPLNKGKEIIYGEESKDYWKPFPNGDLATFGKGRNTIVAVADGPEHHIYLWRQGQTAPQVLGQSKRLITAVGWLQAAGAAKGMRKDPTLVWRSRPFDTAPDWDKAPPKELFDHHFHFGDMTVLLAPALKRPATWHLWSLDEYSLSRQDNRLQVFKNEKKTDVSTAGFPNTGRIHATLIGEKKVATTNPNEGLWVKDLTDGKELRFFAQERVRHLATSPPMPDGKRYFATVGEDNIVRIYDSKGNRLLFLISSGPHWIAWTQAGYYSASAFGEKLIGWKVNRGPDKLARFDPASEFRARFYRPDIVAQVLKFGGVKEAIAAAEGKGAKEDANIENNLPPRVTLLKPESSTIEIKGSKSGNVLIRAEATSEGNNPIHRLRLLIDGRPYTGAGGLVTFAKPKLGALKQEWTIELGPGTYQIGVQAESAGSKARTEWTRGISRLDTGGASAGPDPRLHVLTVGVSKYHDAKLTLNYAHNDANKLAGAFKSPQVAKVFANTKVTTLTDKDATSERFFAELEALRKAMTLHDVAVISFAGHGERNDKGKFFLLPVEVKPDKLAKTAIPGQRLREEMARIPGRIIVLLDACHSGGLETGPAARAADASDDLLRRMVTAECGVVVMCSSTGGEYSLEDKKLQHGLFTKAVLDGLAGAADANKDGYVSLKELDLYVSEEVERLSKGRQHPVTEVPLTFRSIKLTKWK